MAEIKVKIFFGGSLMEGSGSRRPKTYPDPEHWKKPNSSARIMAQKQEDVAPCYVLAQLYMDEGGDQVSRNTGHSKHGSTV
jgi:hypothetical protein